jgi:UDP-glucose 4-epimerase
MSVLITGGTGYIGSNVANLFLKNNIPVIILDNLSNSNFKSISTLSSYKFYYGDYGDKKLLKKIFKENNINTVIHLASNISVGESI